MLLVVLAPDAALVVVQPVAGVRLVPLIAPQDLVAAPTPSQVGVVQAGVFASLVGLLKGCDAIHNHLDRQLAAVVHMGTGSRMVQALDAAVTARAAAVTHQVFRTHSLWLAFSTSVHLSPQSGQVQVSSNTIPPGGQQSCFLIFLPNRLMRNSLAHTAYT